jgi:hypothetical protein
MRDLDSLSVLKPGHFKLYQYEVAILLLPCISSIGCYGQWSGPVAGRPGPSMLIREKNVRIRENRDPN